MSLYKTLFLKILSEDNFAGPGGVFGDTTPGDTFSSDFYAPGDARIPHALGAEKKKKKRKKKKSKRKIDTTASQAFPKVQTRHGSIFSGGSHGSMPGFGS